MPPAELLFTLRVIGLARVNPPESCKAVPPPAAVGAALVTVIVPEPSALAANALGSGTITVTSAAPTAAGGGTALQLSGGFTLANPITLNVNSNSAGGIDGSGSIQSLSGDNTLSGAITQSS